MMYLGGIYFQALLASLERYENMSAGTNRDAECGHAKFSILRNIQFSDPVYEEFNR